jgi:hypothetical protein
MVYRPSCRLLTHRVQVPILFVVLLVVDAPGVRYLCVKGFWNELLELL